MNLVINREIAPFIKSITLSGPDEGANGTINWDLNQLAESNITFPELQIFTIQQNLAGMHNRIIVAHFYDEEGVIAKLVDKCPKITYLTIPSAPDASFFEQKKDNLVYLDIDAGYDTQNFIQNMGKTEKFPKLTYFAWGEYNETYMDDYIEKTTPFEHYRALFKSKVFEKLKVFKLKNPVLTNEQLKSLKELKENIQFQIIKTSDFYV